MKKLLLILLCIPLIFSCGENEKSSKKMNESFDKLSKVFIEECIEGNEGNPDWEAYCDCAGENFTNQLKEMDKEELANITEDDGFAMGMDAGLDCAHLLENEDVIQTDKMEEIMYNALYNSCIEGNAGNPDWEAYCECVAEMAMEAVPNIEDWENMSDEDGMEIGMQAGMECAEYLE